MRVVPTHTGDHVWRWVPENTVLRAEKRIKEPESHRYWSAVKRRCKRGLRRPVISPVIDDRYSTSHQSSNMAPAMV